MLLLVAFQASLGKQLSFAAFVPVWIVAIGAAHCGLFEALAQAKASDLIAGMYTVGKGAIVLEHVIVVFQPVAGTKLKGSSIIHAFVRSVALTTNVHLSLSWQPAWHCNVVGVLLIWIRIVKFDMLFAGAVAPFARNAKDQRIGRKVVGRFAKINVGCTAVNATSEYRSRVCRVAVNESGAIDPLVRIGKIGAIHLKQAVAMPIEIAFSHLG